MNPPPPENINDELRGWIQPCISNSEKSESKLRAELEALGVDVGLWDAKAEEFQNCIVSRKAMERLGSFWGRYIWGLK